jgi:hypothetical protein
VVVSSLPTGATADGAMRVITAPFGGKLRVSVRLAIKEKTSIRLLSAIDNGEGQLETMTWSWS